MKTPPANGAPPPIKMREAPWSAVAAATAFRLWFIRQPCKERTEKGRSCCYRTPRRLRHNRFHDSGATEQLVSTRKITGNLDKPPVKLRLIVALALVLAAGFAASCRENRAAAAPDPLARAYDSENDWNDAAHVIPLSYQQAQGKRVFYQYCVWCHADSTPAGPSNRSNLNPNPPLASDGATLNALSDDFMRNVITLGGAAAGKSAAMPPWGKTLNQDDIDAVIAFYRAIAQPPYQPPARPGPKYSVR